MELTEIQINQNAKKYLIINKENVITNIIVADLEFAQSINAKEFYKGAVIGGTYNPPTLQGLKDDLNNANQTIAELTETIANIMYQQSLKDLNNSTGGTK